MNSGLKRRVYRGIVYTEDQVRNLGKKITQNLSNKIYRGISYIETSTEKVNTERKMMWRGVSYTS